MVFLHFDLLLDRRTGSRLLKLNLLLFQNWRLDVWDGHDRYRWPSTLRGWFLQLPGRFLDRLRNCDRLSLRLGYSYHLPLRLVNSWRLLARQACLDRFLHRLRYLGQVLIRRARLNHHCFFLWRILLILRLFLLIIIVLTPCLLVFALVLSLVFVGLQRRVEACLCHLVLKLSQGVVWRRSRGLGRQLLHIQ